MTARSCPGPTSCPLSSSAPLRPRTMTGPVATLARPLWSCWRRCAPNPKSNPHPHPSPSPSPILTRTPTSTEPEPEPEPEQVRADWFDRWAGGKLKNRGAEYAQVKQAWKELYEPLTLTLTLTLIRTLTLPRPADRLRRAARVVPR